MRCSALVKNEVNSMFAAEYRKCKFKATVYGMNVYGTWKPLCALHANIRSAHGHPTRPLTTEKI